MDKTRAIGQNSESYFSHKTNTFSYDENTKIMVAILKYFQQVSTGMSDPS